MLIRGNLEKLGVRRGARTPNVAIRFYKNHSTDGY